MAKATIVRPLGLDYILICKYIINYRKILHFHIRRCGMFSIDEESREYLKGKIKAGEALRIFFGGYG